MKLGSHGGEGISGEGIPVVKFFTQGSVSSLHAAVILGLTGRKNDERDMEICTGLLELSAKFRPPIHLNRQDRERDLLHQIQQEPLGGRALGMDELRLAVPGLEVLKAEAVACNGHMIDLETFADLHGLILFKGPGLGMSLGEATFLLDPQSGWRALDQAFVFQMTQDAPYGALAEGLGMIAPQDDSDLSLAIGGMIASDL